MLCLHFGDVYDFLYEKGICTCPKHNCFCTYYPQIAQW